PALVPVGPEPAPMARDNQPAFRLLEPPPPAPLPVPPARVLPAERLATEPKPLPPPAERLAVEAKPLSVAAPGCRTAALAVDKVTPATVALNQPASYEIVVHNFGAAAALQVQVEDHMPADANYLRAEPPPALTGEHLVWDLGNLEAGGQRRIRVDFTPTRDLDLLPAARAAFSADCPKRIRRRPAAVRQREFVDRHQPAQIVLKTSGPATVPMGEPALFQIEIANSGDEPPTGLVFHDRL